MNSALGGQADAEKHQASAAKWKWTQIIFLSARILKSILSLLGTFLFFFFSFLFLLSAEGDDEFPSLGSCGNKILIPSLVCRRLVHTHPGENSVCIRGTPDPVFSLCSEGWKAPFLPRCCRKLMTVSPGMLYGSRNAGAWRLPGCI